MRSFDEYRKETELALVPMLASLGSIPDRLKEAMIYSLEAGGKRIRPVLLSAACEMAGGSIKTAIPFACAIEMIHTYSLIHDDLPAMDDDDLRRGKPTSHKVFGEAMAILAGDGLLNAACEIMARASVRMGDLRGIRATEIILRHAGVTGMIAGQSMDILSEGQEPREELVRQIHTHKTADLLQAAIESGLALAGADEKQIQAGSKFGYHTGLAFQMTDDILDITGNEKVLGKQTGQDASHGKMTWVSLKGLEGARKDAEEQIRMAKEALTSLPWQHDLFDQFAEELLTRIQ